MVSWMISRIVVLAFGTLYPAYASYKAVKTKNVKEYVKWMMYWIVFALFTTAETLTDMLLSWFPFYFELKIAFVIWLLSPYTKGSSVLYRKFVHPTLSNKEKTAAPVWDHCFTRTVINDVHFKDLKRRDLFHGVEMADNDVAGASVHWQSQPDVPQQYVFNAAALKAKLKA